MPLNFAEAEKPKVTQDIFVPNPNARPWELEGEVIPELIRRCGDVKAARISLSMVERYLDKNVLVFNRDLLKDLFAEADFRKEGSLDVRALKAALSGRYPKRQLHNEWRQLAALILGVSELTMCEDIKHPKYFENIQDSLLDGPPPELPKISKKTYRTKIMKQPPPDATTAPTNASGQVLTASGYKGTEAMATTTSTVSRTSTQKQPLHATATQPLPGDSLASGRSTFSDVASMERFAACLGLSPEPEPSVTSRDVTRMGKFSVRASSASLPPTATKLPSSALCVLRDSVRSTRSHKPAFSLQSPTLTTSVLDLKKTLGQPLDMSGSLNRVEPTRPDKVLCNADYITWADYCRSDPTAPGKWFNEHPSSPLPPAGSRLLG
mmetsp:Transcript_14429/g.39090  ORF Transcript_14429/g.39090 Transcript_14429/m.39090 type:complete len:380 (+) Transcript_14429:236-1375(+)|eukprot:CAMPEP_0202350078 /NCGR_PEP_ID=MMETSP1126-20121109/7294_1 /ASSEMBLY_ACC=CAM_ASM_000457 /TAXON_ID=3047 /ORGANISM="Dunaliella tertiolecta, Strain CCMP1320" /LENGTH=379 /DNA_ID=CAMNT_0048941977 /DNA_START=171 /DNA_END=1310 /DNA_ORIENTATION=+